MDSFFLADDLSGALDAGAAFHRVGCRVRIALTPEAWGEAASGEVVAVSTETRNAAPEAGAAAVRRALTAFQARGGRLLYKKIDSTLRGPVAAELQALLDALPDVRVLFAPANPRVGRTVQDGVLLVDGVPVAETVFARDPGNPLRQSELRAILGPAATARVSIPDVKSEADLAAAAAEMDQAGRDWVAVGSGALAHCIAARLNGPRAVVPRPSVAPSPVLLVGGSAHPLNRAQQAELARTHGIPLEELDFAHPDRAAAGAGEHVQKRGAVMLRLPVARIEPAVALELLVSAGVAAIERHGIRRIFATGGETAFALCARLGIRSLRFVEEVEPGMAVSVGESVAGTVLLAVKPGGFGDAASWARAWQALQHP